MHSLQVSITVLIAATRYGSAGNWLPQIHCDTSYQFATMLRYHAACPNVPFLQETNGCEWSGSYTWLFVSYFVCLAEIRSARDIICRSAYLSTFCTVYKIISDRQGIRTLQCFGRHVNMSVPAIKVIRPKRMPSGGQKLRHIRVTSVTKT